MASSGEGSLAASIRAVSSEGERRANSRVTVGGTRVKRRTAASVDASVVEASYFALGFGGVASGQEGASPNAFRAR